MKQNRFKSCESACRLGIANAGIELLNVPRQGSRTIRSKGAAMLIRDKVTVDFVGIQRDTGRAFVCDAKSNEGINRFPWASSIGNKSHQRDELVKAGRAGAIAGLLIEAYDRTVNAWYWLNWYDLSRLESEKSLRWDDPAMVPLGSLQTIPNVKLIVSAAQPTSAGGREEL